MALQCRECKSTNLERRDRWNGGWVANDHVLCKDCGYISGVNAETRSATGTYYCGSGQEHWDGLVRCVGMVDIGNGKSIQCGQSTNRCQLHGH